MENLRNSAGLGGGAAKLDELITRIYSGETGRSFNANLVLEHLGEFAIFYLFLQKLKM